MSDIVERLRNYIPGEHEEYVPEVNALAIAEIERLRTLVSDLEDDFLRRHRDACNRWEALMDIRMVANEPGDRRALIDKIYGIATKAVRSKPAPPSPIGIAESVDE